MIKETVNSGVSNFFERLGRVPKPFEVDLVIDSLLPNRLYRIAYIIGMERRGKGSVVFINDKNKMNYQLKNGDSLLDALAAVGGRMDAIIIKGRFGRKIMEIPARIETEAEEG